MNLLRLSSDMFYSSTFSERRICSHCEIGCLPGTRAAHAIHRHRSAHLLKSRLFRRARRQRHQVHQHPRDVLVGGNHHDDGGIRRHVPVDGLGEVDRCRVLCLRCACHRAAYTHHRQQFRRVLPGPGARFSPNSNVLTMLNNVINIEPFF